MHNEKDISGSQIHYIHITKPELTHIQGPCSQKLVIWFDLEELINSRIISMDNKLKFQKPIILIFIWLE